GRLAPQGAADRSAHRPRREPTVEVSECTHGERPQGVASVSGRADDHRRDLAAESGDRPPVRRRIERRDREVDLLQVAPGRSLRHSPERHADRRPAKRREDLPGPIPHDDRALASERHRSCLAPHLRVRKTANLATRQSGCKPARRPACREFTSDAYLEPSTRRSDRSPASRPFTGPVAAGSIHLPARTEGGHRSVNAPVGGGLDAAASSPLRPSGSAQQRRYTQRGTTLMTWILGPARSRRRRFLLVPIVLVAAIALPLAGIAQAVHDLTFELDGNQAVDTPGRFDWTSFFNAAGQPSPALPDASRPGFTNSGFSKDFSRNADGSYSTADHTTFATGSKDTLSITPGWQCSFANNVNDKIDILNAYAVAYTNPANGHEILYFGLERFSNSGDANVGFWFLQDNVNCVSPGGSTAFTGNHVDGDLLIVSAFTNGGVVSTIDVYRWNG